MATELATTEYRLMPLKRILAFKASLQHLACAEIFCTLRYHQQLP